MKVKQFWIFSLVLGLGGCLFSDDANNTSPNNTSPNNVSPNNVSPNNVSPNNVSPNNVSPNNVSPNNVSPNNQGELDCGNGELDLDEECDGTADPVFIDGATCESMNGQGSSGDLICNLCEIDTQDCSASCGNGIAEDGEECDGVEVNVSCAELVGEGSTGTPGCNDECESEIGSCTQVYKQISAGGAHTCGLKYDGTVRCWGAGDGTTAGFVHRGQSIVPIGIRFESISSGGLHTCGIDLTGSVSCWGWNDDDQSDDQAGNFVRISAGIFHTCGLLENGVFVCWGDQQRFRGLGSIVGDVDSIGSGRVRTCYLQGTRVSCTGPGAAHISISGSYSSINPGGGSFMCGIPQDAVSEYCWGDALEPVGQGEVRAHDIQPAPGNIFTSIDAGRYHACGINQNNLVSCWGRERSFEDLPAAVEFREISVGDFHACGLTMSGEALCWGSNVSRQTLVPPLTDRLLLDEEL